MGMYLAVKNLNNALDDCMEAVLKESMSPDTLKGMSESDLQGIKTVLKVIDASKELMEECVHYMDDQNEKLDEILSEIKKLNMNRES